MTFKIPLPLPAVGVFVVSFPVEFILKTKEKKGNYRFAVHQNLLVAFAISFLFTCNSQMFLCLISI